MPSRRFEPLPLSELRLSPLPTKSHQRQNPAGRPRCSSRPRRFIRPSCPFTCLLREQTPSPCSETSAPDALRPRSPSPDTPAGDGDQTPAASQAAAETLRSGHAPQPLPRVVHLHLNPCDRRETKHKPCASRTGSGLGRRGEARPSPPPSAPHRGSNPQPPGARSRRPAEPSEAERAPPAAGHTCGGAGVTSAGRAHVPLTAARTSAQV